MRGICLLLAFWTSLLSACEVLGTDTCDPDTLAGCDGYSELFGGRDLHRLEITIGTGDFNAARDDLQSILGAGFQMDMESPMWFPVQLEMNGQQWSQVGMRFKGNSSLFFPWSTGSEKLPFRFNFQRFDSEGDLFYGFRKMTFANGFHDPSQVRDRLAADVFREVGVPVARSTSVEVYVDHGEGQTYWGLYTMIEDPSDRMKDMAFGSPGGNLYKPEGPAARWQSFSSLDFKKKSNKTEADYSDVEGAIGALHGDRSDPDAWRAELETHLDVDGFLKWLAANQAMVNWDTYGWMAHNYYLYGDPSQGGRLRFIPWDLNEALAEPQRDFADSISLDRLSGSWPLIQKLLDDEIYQQRYQEALVEVATGAFSEAAMADRIEDYQELIAEAVYAEQWPHRLSPPEAFEEAFAATGQGSLKLHVNSRHKALLEAGGNID